jgi:hypothetical protein
MQAQDKPSVPKRVYQTKALGDLPSPEIDGLINEACWNTVEWTGDYIENQPDENTPPTEQTKFKLSTTRNSSISLLNAMTKIPKASSKGFRAAMV